MTSPSAHRRHGNCVHIPTHTTSRNRAPPGGGTVAIATIQRCERVFARSTGCHSSPDAEFRRDIAEKVPIERLTARQIETIRDLPLRADWRTVRQVATTPSSEIETLAQELERALLREAFRSSALLIVGGIFGWRPRRSNRVLPPSFIIVPEQDATTRQRIIVGMTPHITEALRRGLPPHRPERNLYEALDHLDHLFSHHAHTADAEVLRWIRLETQLSLLAV